MLRWSLQLHKWIALIVGIQVLLWVAGGVVMTAIPIERVRSEHHAAERTSPPLAFEGLKSPQAAAGAAGAKPSEALLKTTPRGAVWVFKDADGKTTTVDAVSARPLPRLSSEEARRLAAAAYVGDGKPVSSRFLAVAPQETGREGPLWRVDFDDAEKTSFYLSPETGEVVSRRSDVWRFYDFFWRLHIMDLETGENFNHPLIIGASLLTLAVVVTGFILLWIRLTRDFRAARTRQEQAPP